MAAADDSGPDTRAGAVSLSTVTTDGLSVVARKNLLLLVQLRWIAVVGQIATMVVAHIAFGVVLPLAPMVSVLLALAALNVTSLVRLSRRTPVGPYELFAALVFDVAALTVQLYLSGGASNPFTFLYLLQVTLGAVLLDARSTWILVVLAGLCFAVLTEIYRPLDFLNHDDTELFRLHIYGTWFCFALDAGLLVVFVGRINRNLRERDARLADLRQHAAEEDHIVRMGLLASGAAHELGTPLSTLSVILGDWKRMPILAADADLAQEIEAMEAEVKRCKAIVTGILLSSGEARGESASVTTMLTFLDDLVEEWRMSRVPALLRYDNAFGEDLPVVSEAAVKQVVFNVLDNALEASPHAVEVTATREGDALVLSVSDDGPGFLPEILQHLGKPYRSSKGREGGGLGLFLVFNVVRKLGGQVTARNRSGGGAMVTLSLPVAALAIDWGRPHDD
jgi:two-component system sensor histidine kinase RegB